MTHYTKAKIIINESYSHKNNKDNGVYTLSYSEVEDMLLESRGKKASIGLEALYDNDVDTVIDAIATVGCQE